ncbi:HAD hydrolase-like protein [Bacillus sp. N9]
MLVSELKVPSERCIVVGDRLNTDIRLGKSAGMLTAWIRAHNEPLPSNVADQPNYTINSIAELPKVLEPLLQRDLVEESRD